MRPRLDGEVRGPAGRSSCDSARAERASSLSQRQIVVPLICGHQALGEDRPTQGGQRPAGQRQPTRCGSSQASAFTSTLTAGGKAGRAAAARAIGETGEAMKAETPAPFADDLAQGIEAGRDDVVGQSRAGQQHDPRPDHVPIRRLIFARPPDQLGTLLLVSLMEKGLFLGMFVPPAEGSPVRFAWRSSTKYVTVFMKLGTKCERKQGRSSRGNAAGRTDWDGHLHPASGFRGKLAFIGLGPASAGVGHLEIFRLAPKSDICRVNEYALQCCYGQ